MLAKYVNKSFPALPAGKGGQPRFRRADATAAPGQARLSRPCGSSRPALQIPALLLQEMKKLEPNALRDMLENEPAPQKNVFGEPLQTCSDSPVTGFFRDGCCNTGPEDLGSHTVCAVMTAEFLEFSKKAGNDLSTPMPEFDFPGLKPGGRWCLCAARWRQAFEAGMAPKVVLAATHESALEIVALKDLKRFAIDLS